MTTAQIKTLLGLEGWLRLRKARDDAGNSVREFQSPDDPDSFCYVVTDPADVTVIDRAYLWGSAPPLAALKDSTRWWATSGQPNAPTLTAKAIEDIQADFDAFRKSIVPPFTFACTYCRADRGEDVTLHIIADSEHVCYLRLAPGDGHPQANWNGWLDPDGWRDLTEADVARIRAYETAGGGCAFECACVDGETEVDIYYEEDDIHFKEPSGGAGTDASDNGRILAQRIIDGDVNLLGWARPDQFVFAMCKDPDNDSMTFCVTPLAFWKAEKCLDDQSLACWIVSGYGLAESMESVFEPTYGEDGELLDPKEIRQALLDAGFVEDKAFTKYIKRGM